MKPRRLLKSQDEDKYKKNSEFVNSDEEYPMIEITYEVFQLMEEMIEQFSFGPLNKTFSILLKRTINIDFEPKRISKGTVRLAHLARHAPLNARVN